MMYGKIGFKIDVYKELQLSLDTKQPNCVNVTLLHKYMEEKHHVVLIKQHFNTLLIKTWLQK